MYIPPHYAQTQPEHLHRIMRTHPLGALVTSSPTSESGGLDADQLVATVSDLPFPQSLVRSH